MRLNDRVIPVDFGSVSLNVVQLFRSASAAGPLLQVDSVLLVPVSARDKEVTVSGIRSLDVHRPPLPGITARGSHVPAQGHRIHEARRNQREVQNVAILHGISQAGGIQLDLLDGAILAVFDLLDVNLGSVSRGRKTSSQLQDIAERVLLLQLIDCGTVDLASHGYLRSHRAAK